MGVPSVSDVLSIPTRAGGITNGANSLAAYFAQQQQARQGLQLQQAQTLSNYQNIIQASTGQRNPNIDAMLAQNPYGRQMVPQGQPQSQSQGGQQSPMMGGGMFGGMGGGMFNPLNNASGPVVTGQSQTFASFGDMGPKTTTSIANPLAEAQVQSAKTTGEDVSKEGVAQDSAFYQVGNSVRNIISDLKSAQIQSGGSGRIPGMIGSLAESMGAPDTGNIGSYDAAKTEGAINLARIASGGSRGIASIFQKFEHGFPELSDPDQTQMTKGATLFRTALSFRRAADSLRQKYTDNQLDAMSPTKLQSLLEQQQEEVSPDDQKQINDYIGGMIKSVPAAPTFSSQGQVATQMNPLSRAVATSPFGKTLGFNQQGQNQSAPPQQNKAMQFINGKTYVDGKGNKATYQNGKWIESQ